MYVRNVRKLLTESDVVLRVRGNYLLRWFTVEEEKLCSHFLRDSTTIS